MATTFKFGFYVNQNVKKVKLHREDCPHCEKHGGKHSDKVKAGWVWCDSGHDDQDSYEFAKSLGELVAEQRHLNLTDCQFCQNAGRI